jgi:hypothetical protein
MPAVLMKDQSYNATARAQREGDLRIHFINEEVGRGLRPEAHC